MKSRTSWRNRFGSNTPLTSTSSCGSSGGAIASPVIVRQGMNREHTVKGTVALLQGGSRRIHELAEGVLKRFRWEVGV